MKKLFWALLIGNLMFFALMQWGAELTIGNESAEDLHPLNEDKIRLLAALPPAAPGAPAHPVAAPPPAPPVLPVSAPVETAQQRPVAEEMACLEWGEFSGAELLRAQAALQGLKLGARLSQRQVEYSSGYWVYIPPVKTRADIEGKISVLRKRGITDIYVIQEPGKWQNALSLGLFKTSAAAHKFLEALHARGIKTPVVGERQSTLKFTVFMLKDPGAEIAQKMNTLRAEFSGSELRPVPCN